MSEKQAMLNLKKVYKNNRKWVQSTKSYGFYTYPHSYYKELVDIVLKYKRSQHVWTRVLARKRIVNDWETGTIF